ncbi:BolA family protein [Ectothiorhodospira marina]|jgi:acid stress-induced BolA-like protein IbaG/YrbA|uniref:Acid stress-induced BolA-like protein IbaG/YrbA, predicted regulator of iron metabolism n=1 Tax=Ectothiorhodospira marina TaxID=1396821 RepID=A0A1H7QJX3_9GAMM|nr:BolA/IbaG family iron-sulfur metabolism protein [Ectothiorhodospira marina]SEL48068.1 Acid stress-induced BolA-like protein IbaG/YrbA, predicted regulator of iron metabolism [Ectothiorhodospira marina]
MTPDQVKTLIETGLPGARVSVTGGDGHFEARVISEAFAGQSRIKRHQMVNATVIQEITSGALHALSMRTFTPDEADTNAS